MKTFFVGIAGGTGAGKTTLATELTNRLGNSAVLIAHDSYYRDLSTLPQGERARTNFDAPDALETELLAAHLDALRKGQSVRVPRYDFSTHSRIGGEEREVGPSSIVVVEGILLLSDLGICERLDLRVFVETDADERILRRIQRDVDERGRSVSSVMEQYLTTVKPMHALHVTPSRALADLVVNGGRDTNKAVDLIVAHAKARLSERPPP
jgi:uridine kinase